MFEPGIFGATYREDYQSIDDEANDTIDGEPNSDGKGGRFKQ